MTRARRPDPQTILMVAEGTSFGMPAAMAACLAGFCPHPVARIHLPSVSLIWVNVVLLSEASNAHCHHYIGSL